MPDVIVIGAGLAGLSAARDLMRAGVDVIVVEARGRVGGRVEQVTLNDGRLVQLGGEIVGTFHTAYLELLEELGLTQGPTYVAEPGELTWYLAEGVFIGDDAPWQSAAERADGVRVESLFNELLATVDPDDPWSHPDARRLDQLSVAQWMRDVGAVPATLRAREAARLGLSADSYERSSLLGELRKAAAAGPESGFYNYEKWESIRCVEGSATVVLRMAAELGERVQVNQPVTRIDIERRKVRVTVSGGEVFQAEAVVCTIPVGPLRDVEIVGLSPERLSSLRRMRHALAAKIVAVYQRSFWRELGANGLSEGEGVFGSTWPQIEGVLSMLVPPERLSFYLATAPESRRGLIIDQLVRMFGREAKSPVAYFTRDWGVDPYTKGYITSWAPGDVLAVGPLHGKHEPPFFVAGSDHWVAGYMEGAVRTGRAAAAAALAS